MEEASEAHTGGFRVGWRENFRGPGARTQYSSCPPRRSVWEPSCLRSGPTTSPNANLLLWRPDFSDLEGISDLGETRGMGDRTVVQEMGILAA